MCKAITIEDAVADQVRLTIRDLRNRPAGNAGRSGRRTQGEHLSQRGDFPEESLARTTVGCQLVGIEAAIDCTAALHG